MNDESETVNCVYSCVQFWVLLPVQVIVPVFSAGDTVKVIADRSKVEELQCIYGIWNDAMIEVRQCKF